MQILLSTFLVALSGAGRGERADLKLHSLFSDNMVLQRGMAVPVWGWAAPGEEVTVAVGGRKKSAKAGANGKWKVSLDALKAGGPYEVRISGKTSVTLRNVLVGDVWICSGQSNMQWPVSRADNAAQEIATAHWPKIRLFSVPRVPADSPQENVVGSWSPCSPETVGGFSAVGYYFGRELQPAIDVPVGLIHTSWGGTAAELWTRREVFESSPGLKDLVAFYEKRKASYPKAVERWKAAAAKAKAEGKKAPRRPRQFKDASSLYNGMIAPLIPFAIKGAIWYQGESNAGQPQIYRTLFPTMIRNWREDWAQGDFSFLFVQLANWRARKAEPVESKWAELREAQLRTLSLPKTGMAVIIDIGEANDIHPRNKQDVGRRLALSARKVAYGEDLVHSGPIYRSMKVEGNKARLAFDHVGSGLVARGGSLRGFSIAGGGGKFSWASAEIQGEEIVVWSEGISAPKAVRYAWADNPACNLYNAEGLPASPFRTDGPRP